MGGSITMTCDWARGGQRSLAKPPIEHAGLALALAIGAVALRAEAAQAGGRSEPSPQSASCVGGADYRSHRSPLSPRPMSRQTSLDYVRGLAVLGILLMNAVALGISFNAYYNTGVGGLVTPLDRGIAWAGEVFVDQKFMGLFSMLFGASIVLFAERAEAKGSSALGLSLWRNALLLVIGIGHSLLWMGDVLLVYALCAPVLLLLRRLPGAALGVLGALIYATSVLLLCHAQDTVTEAELVGYWLPGGGLDSAAGEVVALDAVVRALGGMLVGMSLYRAGWLTTSTPPIARRLLAVAFVVVGAIGGAASVAWAHSAAYAPDVAFVHNVPNTLGALPMAVGYAVLFTMWDARAPLWWATRVRALGRMALTNYILQTVIALTVFAFVPEALVSRTVILAFVVCVWALQLSCSLPWLKRFRYGPLEWVWRSATYRRLEPMRRERAGATR